MKDGIRLGQRVIAGVVAERAFVAQRLGRVNEAFDDEVGLPAEASAQAGVGQTVFDPGKMFSRLGQTEEKMKRK